MKLLTRWFSYWALGLSLVFLSLSAAHAQETSVYKWVDEGGMSHFTDRPPESGEAERLAINSKRTDKEAVAQQLAARAEWNESAAKEKSRQAEKAADDKKERRQAAEDRTANCTKARKIFQKYNDAKLIYNVGEDGERVYLNDEQLDQTRDSARQSVQEWCGG